MVLRRHIIPVLVAGGLMVLAACGRDDTYDLDVGNALYELTVIDAVQLGADQGCHQLASKVTGSISIIPLAESDDLVLLLEDGYPLCIDTMQNVGTELEMVEATYLDQAPGDGGTSVEGLEQLMLGSEEEPEGSGQDNPTGTDPNPQPASPPDGDPETSNPTDTTNIETSNPLKATATPSSASATPPDTD